MGCGIGPIVRGLAGNIGSGARLSRSESKRKEMLESDGSVEM